jgi:hypothetical protein
MELQNDILACLGFEFEVLTLTSCHVTGPKGLKSNEKRKVRVVREKVQESNVI